MILRNMIAAVATVATLGGAANAQTDPFASGWALDGDASTLNFVSVKKGTLMEMSRFDTLNGVINEAGDVTLQIPLDSVDTTVDLRNVRMRFLFFETFLHPQAVISTKITQDMLQGLEATGTKSITLPFLIELHGVTQQMTAEVLVHMIGPDRVSVSSIAPIIMKVDDFGLMGGLEKLQEAAEVTIVPATSVTFNFAFDRNTATAPTNVLPALASVSTALEPTGAFSREACEGRFEILSRSGNINFQTGSATLRAESRPLLENVADIVSRCPGMIVRVAGHTDSLGDAGANMRLSERRSRAIVDYLVAKGLPQERFLTQGYGETKPIATNGTARGRLANRRIEFSLAGFIQS